MGLGPHTITVTASDAAGNINTATTTFTVNDTTAPVPNVASLPIITEQCSATVAAPTATDNCAGSITGTTSDPTTYASQGTFVIHWAYNDGHGNVATQNQTVVIKDTTPPSITAPPAITAYTGAAALCGVVITDLGTANATDN